MSSIMSSKFPRCLELISSKTRWIGPIWVSKVKYLRVFSGGLLLGHYYWAFDEPHIITPLLKWQGSFCINHCNCQPTTALSHHRINWEWRHRISTKFDLVRIRVFAKFFDPPKYFKRRWRAGPRQKYILTWKDGLHFFFNCFTWEKILQIKFSHQNFSVENSYIFLTAWWGCIFYTSQRKNKYSIYRVNWKMK